MKGATVILELHGWRGVKRAGGPLGTVLTVGWLSVSYLPFLLSTWLRSRVNALKNAVSSKEVPPRAEMGCWGEDRPLHVIVPRGRT